MKRLINTIILFHSILCFAVDGFHYEANLEEVHDDDFYEINLRPSILSKLQPEFYDLKIIDTNEAPVPYILKEVASEFFEVKGLNFTAEHTSEKSVYTFSSEQELFFSGIHINHGEHVFFHRNARIKYLDIADSLYYNTHEFELKSTDKSIISFDKKKTTVLILEVINGDNPPIPFNTFNVYGPKVSLISKLSPNMEYKLLLGKKNTKAPNYDLIHFEKYIPKDIRSIKVLEIEKTDSPHKVKAKSTSKNAPLIWGILIAIILVTSAITFKVLKDLK